MEALAKGTLRWNDKAWPLPIEMATLQEVFAIGPTHHLIGHLYKGDPMGAFELHEVQSEADALGSDRALWRADAKNQRRLIVRPTHKGVAPAGVGSDEAREKIRQKKGTLHYTRNMRWTSQALLAATTERRAMGGRAWTTLMHADERVRKVFALWANSTLGMMVHWMQGQRTHAGRSTTQIGAVKKIPRPRLNTLDGHALDEAAKAFDQLAGRNLLPACQAHADAVRMAIDEAVIRLFGWDERARGVVKDLRTLWCREPSVHGSNKGVRHLLDG